MLKNIKIYDNTSHNEGSGIDTHECSNGEITLFDIYENSALIDGGGVVINNSNNIIF